MEPPSSVIYNSLRYDDSAGVVTFHLRERDWNQLKSRGWMWFSSRELIKVIECQRIFLGDERVKKIGRVDPVQTFGLFSVQPFSIVESSEATGHILRVCFQYSGSRLYPTTVTQITSQWKDCA